jgi:pentatricopeptide repeat protein
VEKVFDEMSHRDLVSWNAMMVGFLENKLYGHAIGVFREVVHHDSLDHDQVTFSSVWSACNVLVFLIMTLGFMYMGILLSVV